MKNATSIKVSALLIFLLLLIYRQEMRAQNAKQVNPISGTGDSEKTKEHKKSTKNDGNGTTIVVWPRQSILFFAGGGILSPTGDVKTNTGINSLTDFNLSAYIPIKSFNKWSIGMEAGGGYSFSNKDNCPATEPFQVMGQMAPPVINEKGTGSPKAAGFRISAGPAAVVHLSEKFILLPSLNAVYSSFKESSCTVTQTSQVNGITYNWDIARHSSKQSSGIGFMPKLKLVYLFGRIGVWAETNYMMVQKINTSTSRLTPEGSAANGLYDWGQMNTHTYNTTTASTTFKAISLGGGITISLGKHRDKSGRDNSVQEYGGATGGVINKNETTGTAERIINTNQNNPIINNPLYHLPPYWFTQCINDRKVALYVVHGLVIDAVYSNLPCNSSTWPTAGVPGHGGIFKTEATRYTVVLDKTKWSAAKEKMSFEQLSDLPISSVPSGAKLIEILLVKSKDKASLIHNYRFDRDTRLNASVENLTIVTPLTTEGEMLKTEGYHIVCRTSKNGTTVEQKHAATKRADYVGHVTLLR